MLAVASAPTTARPPARRYVIREVLLSGASATLFRAELLAAGQFTRAVTLKVLNAARAHLPEEVASLQDEARTLGALRHRAIVSALGTLTVAGRPAIVLESVSGVDLAALVALGPLPASAALEIVEEVAGALDLAWRASRGDGQPLRLTHRAVGLRTVRVSPEGGVKLIGFEFARSELQDRAARTRALERPVAPEQTRGEEGPATDVYALGAVLYHLVRGRPLPRLGGRAETREATLSLALDELDVQEPTRGGLIALLSELLAADPRARPSARAVLARATELRRQAVGPSLGTWAAGAVPAASRFWRAPKEDPLVGRVVEEGGDAAPLEPAAPEPAPGPSWSRILPWAALGALLAGASVLSGGLALWLAPTLLQLLDGALSAG